MTIKILSRLAGVFLVTLGLAGCMDVSMEIDVTSETGGKSTTISTMGADVYAMVKSGMNSAEKSEGDFCTEEGAKLVENADGSAVCTIVVEGNFDQIKGEGEDTAKFEVVSPGVVKVSFSTTSMKGQLGNKDDPESLAMMEQMFAGHTITLRIKGKELLDTNMEKVDGVAQTVIPFTDLIKGTVNLPDELYATVKVN